ncbi:unnamed protein product [Hymenolepis diminuta]|uniref:Beta-lactamase n=1 Tax=Hymenolepis diminuta TaxID=6216 RepID=A0A0R3SQ22_HYMDI|nr:unnamed protein product [Hymenolepis diminuta]VUZ54313.1 unnamed protein product [Hymenolepis diminuta]
MIRLSFFIILLFVWISPISSVSYRWFKQVAERTNTSLVVDAYYAKCLVDAPDYLNSCGTVTYGVGLTPRSAKDFARFYAVATGEPHCNGYIGQCLIRQYCSK